MKYKNRLGLVVPYLYIMPAILIVTLIIVFPVVNIIVNSFFTTVGGKEVWFGINNYIMIFKDDLFWTSILNNLRLFASIPFITVFAILIAALLYDKILGWHFYQSIIFTPYILAIPVVGIVFSYILQYKGVLNTLLASIGCESLVKDWLGTPKLAIWSIVAVVVWKQIGFGVVLFLARLGSVPPVLYEAATVDGAGWWKKLIHVTLPQLATTIEFFIIINIINMLSWVFDFVFVMTGGGPVNSTYVMEYFIYQKAFAGSLVNMGEAAGVIVLIFAICIIAAESIIRKRLEDFQ
ncbi:multiple sugar transport system permease protein/raffinose/stachyose/melibiose transport system permease protein [Ruminiclostridium sufflavum DSM 19573]|uniref:Multiple sugar transport system permease protein/raffinose/stachyose/melibiose transport system permease protein n=1 Tax=Ruminiclostridium sufflavum DSM 19573 TaxID=1121337 RepID=A0A318YCR0_9FIRM|nr:sugar ABC transporter permease [Ruminiclostridium sufflavum]PYG90402.1 multiple sugar transport system permease protein/raffinose/stachyose/melibiose transport system permease protein [Ruminiclostridium sufflavum DSM 19573]